MNPNHSRANTQQHQAIQTTEGPLLIIAGPGSGKTFTLVERLVEIIQTKSVAPENLFIVTFTDKAAQELRTRVSSRLLALGIRFNLNEMYFGTFHSICLRLLEEYRDYTRLKRNYTLMDQFDQQFFFFQHIYEYQKIAQSDLVMGPATSGNWYQSQQLLKWINKVAEEALDPDVLCKSQWDDVRALGECFKLYQHHLNEENALDFSTIQYEALKLLRTQPQVRAALRERFQYLMVDEYQDTSAIQEMILEELSGGIPNLCVVGDDDQGLYRFRCASIRNILEFKDNFPPKTCKEVTLQTNYRSHPDIIGLYNSWMGEQDWDFGGKTFRLHKHVTPDPDAIFPQTVTTLKLSAGNADAWHRETLAFLHKLKDEGGLTDWNQVAFLFYSVKNARVVALANYLENAGIPVYSPRSNMFFDREEIRLMIGALIFLFPQFRDVRALQSGATLDIWDYYDNDCFALFAAQLRLPENKDLLRWAQGLARKHRALTENTDYAFTGLFYQLLQFPLFSRFVNVSLTGNVTDTRSARNLAIFSQLLGKFEYLRRLSVFQPKYLDDNIRRLFNQFFRYLKDGGINEYEDDSEYAPSGHVSFLTIHQSKGMEFPVVIAGSLDRSPRQDNTALAVILEREYSHRPPYEPRQMTHFYDFRRLYYTAFSRAQNLLVLTCQEKYTRQGALSHPTREFRNVWSRVVDWRDSRFDPTQLQLATVKDVLLKREYSFTSHITVFENCAEQYRFYRALEFAPVRKSPVLFGTLVHQTIEDMHKAILRGETHKVNEEQIRSWFDLNYAALTQRERVYLSPYPRNEALEHVLRYYRRTRNTGEWERLREAEVDVSLVKDTYILSGSIDLIKDQTGAENTVEIVDFKSEKKIEVNAKADREKLERYRRQLEVYAHIVQERTGLKVSRTHLYYTSEEAGNPYVTFPKNDASINETIAAFDNVVNRIESKDFALKERPAKLCNNCDMRHYCDAKKTP